MRRAFDARILLFHAACVLCAQAIAWPQPLAEARQVTRSYNFDLVPASTGHRSVMITMVAGRQQLFLLDELSGRWTQITHDDADHEDPAWSPDGQRLAFVLATDSSRVVYVSDPNGKDRKPLTPANVRAIHPSWTADGRRILYSTDDDLRPPAKNASEIYSLDVTTLAIDTLISGGVNTFPVMSPDGQWLAFRRIVGDMNSEVFLAKADGTGARNLTNHPSYEGWPAWSPDGSRIAFAANRNGEDHQIFIMQADGSNVRLVADTRGRATSPKWVPDGQSLFFTNCFPEEEGGGCEIMQARVDQLPAFTVLLHEDGVENAYPRLSADGKRILYQSKRTGKWQLYIMDIATNKQERITSDAFNNNFPDWSADGQWIAFVSDRDGNEEIYRMKVDGSGLERLTSDPARDIHPYFSPDGKYLLFNSTRGNGSLDIYRLTLADKKLDRITNSPMEETCARYSPDMKQVVFLRNDESRDDIALMDMSTGLVTDLTHTPRITDGWPMFSADGRWIYYSTMATGQHSIHRIHPDGRGDETLTDAAPGEEDGRAFISNDGRTLIYNKRKGRSIDILRIMFPPAH